MLACGVSIFACLCISKLIHSEFDHYNKLLRAVSSFILLVSFTFKLIPSSKFKQKMLYAAEIFLWNVIIWHSVTLSCFLDVCLMFWVNQELTLSLFILNVPLPASEIRRLKLNSEGHVQPSPLKQWENGRSYPLEANSAKLYHFEMLMIRALKPEDKCLEAD